MVNFVRHARPPFALSITLGLILGLTSACGGRTPKGSSGTGDNLPGSTLPGGTLNVPGDTGTPGNTTDGTNTPDGLAGCIADHTCEDGTYCHFPNTSPWVDGTRGTCEAHCTSHNSCELGQRCVRGRCYSNLGCEPGNGHNDCPPGEVCNPQTHICGTPPTQCAFQDQCPTDWICERDGTCRHPESLDFGSCSSDNDCSALTECAGNACWCEANSCVPRQCQQPSECGIGNDCVRGHCRPTRSCQSHQQCISANLICEAGYCVQPDSCARGETCGTGFSCNQNVQPPACLPGSNDQCNRDEQCGVSEYCDLFTGRCLTGCRNDAACEGKCGTSACYCGNNRSCTDVPPTAGGNEACGDHNECGSGTACAPDDPANPLCLVDDLLGGFPIPIPGMEICEQSCRQVCDLLVSFVVNPCPQGQSCQAPTGALVDLIGGLVSGEFDPDSTVGFCYPGEGMGF